MVLIIVVQLLKDLYILKKNVRIIGRNAFSSQNISGEIIFPEEMDYIGSSSFRWLQKDKKEKFLLKTLVCQSV